MALLINKQLTILGELTVNSIYLRISYNVDKNGISIKVNLTPYISKISYKNNSDNVLNIQGISNSYKMIYNRELNGNDLLTHIHNYIIEKLTTDEIVNIEKFDENGQIVSTPTLIKSKFADISEISIVDI